MMSDNFTENMTEFDNSSLSETQTEDQSETERDNEKEIFDIDSKSSGKVINVNIYDENLIKIICENYIIKIYAMADCCSESWFEFPFGNIKSINKRHIKNITVGKYIKLPPSHRQESDLNNLITIQLENETYYNHPLFKEFSFVLRNSSNGYYSGWIDIDYEGFYSPQ